MKKHILLFLLFTQSIAFAQQPVRDAFIGMYSGRRINMEDVNIEEQVSVKILPYDTDTGLVIIDDLNHNLKDTLRFQYINSPVDTQLWDNNQWVGVVNLHTIQFNYFDPLGSQIYPIWWYDLNYTSPLEIQENFAAQIKLYPNPATDYITIKSSYPIKNYIVYNIYGQMVTDGKNLETLNISKLCPALYFIQLNCGNYTIKKNFIKN